MLIECRTDPLISQWRIPLRILLIVLVLIVHLEPRCG